MIDNIIFLNCAMTDDNPIEEVNIFASGAANRIRTVDQMLADSASTATSSSTSVYSPLNVYSPATTRPRTIIEPLDSSNLNARKFTRFQQITLQDLAVDGAVTNTKGYLDL